MSPFLRHRVTLQLAIRMPDEGGGASLVWSDEALLWARITSQGGDEIARAGELVPHARYRVMLRYRDGVSSAMRLLFGSKALAIDAAYDPDGDRRMLLVDCHEAAP